jgi:hypothetical protein
MKSAPSVRIRSKVRVFPLAGRFDYVCLNGPHKTMIWVAANLFGSKEIKNHMKSLVDGVAKENLGELLSHLKSSN